MTAQQLNRYLQVNASANRDLLALGNAATEDVSAFATSNQGSKADSALQPNGDGSALTGLTKAQVGLSNVNDVAVSVGVASTTTVGIVTVNTQSITIGATTKAVLTT